MAKNKTVTAKWEKVDTIATDIPVPSGDITLRLSQDEAASIVAALHCTYLGLRGTGLMALDRKSAAYSKLAKKVDDAIGSPIQKWLCKLNIADESEASRG